ncbi:hypothetical protein V5O48_017314, partial [Marasmius crinis-equi]
SRQLSLSGPGQAEGQGSVDLLSLVHASGSGQASGTGSIGLGKRDVDGAAQGSGSGNLKAPGMDLSGAGQAEGNGHLVVKVPVVFIPNIRLILTHRSGKMTTATKR